MRMLATTTTISTNAPFKVGLPSMLASREQVSFSDGDNREYRNLS
jgi:hypothetical protein